MTSRDATMSADVKGSWLSASITRRTPTAPVLLTRPLTLLMDRLSFKENIYGLVKGNTCGGFSPAGRRVG